MESMQVIICNAKTASQQSDSSGYIVLKGTSVLCQTRSSKGLFKLGTNFFCVSYRICRKDVGRGF